MFKLLVVDDESIERDAQKYIINSSDVEIDEILEASNGEEAISVAAVYKPEIIFMDIKMPGLNGIESSKIIRKILPDCKIVFLTAFNEFDYAHEAIKLGVEDFIIKPATNDRILEVLRKVINQLNKDESMKLQKESMETKFSQISRCLVREFVTSIASGEIDDEQIKEYLEVMNIRFKYGYGVFVRIIYGDKRNLSSLKEEMIKKRFLEKFSAKLDERGIKIFANSIRSKIHVLVLGYGHRGKEEYIENFKEVFQQIQKEFRNNYALEIHMGIGQVCENISELWKSFSQAKVYCKNHYLQDRIEGNEKIDKIDPLYIKEKELCEAILHCDEKKVLKKLDDILDNIIFLSSEINSIRLRIYELIVIINKYITDELKSKNKVSEKHFNDLNDIHSKGEAKEYIKQYLLKIIDNTKEMKTDRTGALLDKVVKHIKLHYADSISLEDMANMSGFSTYYFCKMFKKYYNVNFTDYLTLVRLDEAKKLLGNPHVNIKEISERIGYVNPNYFTRVFKKHEGITPSDYRSQNLYY